MGEVTAARRQWDPHPGPGHVRRPQGHVVRQLLAARGLAQHERQVSITGALAWLTTAAGWPPEEALDTLTIICGRPGRQAAGSSWRLMGTRHADRSELIRIGEQ